MLLGSAFTAAFIILKQGGGGGGGGGGLAVVGASLSPLTSLRDRGQVTEVF